MTDTFQSSDSVRSGRTLKYVQSVTFDGPVKLELGGTLPAVTVAYETYGTLNAARDNAVLVCHALTGDSHVAAHDSSDDPGWWEILIGPGKPLDTNKYFVICPNILGGCRGTTGPGSINPDTGRPYGADFPTITIGDIVEVHRQLVDHLGINVLRGAIGGSLGGHQVMTWAIRYPERLRGAIPLATSPRLNMQSLAFDVIGRNAIQRDPNYHDGQYYDKSTGPNVGLALARMLGHITYLSLQAMQNKFEADRFQPRDVATEFEKKFSVGSYLAYQGDKFVERFDANSYVAITMAMDLFDLGDTPEKLKKNLERSRCRWLMASFTSDWLFPPEQSQEIVNALLSLGREVTYCNVQSSCGHDAFLLPDDVATYGELVRAFLDNFDETILVTGDDDVYAPTSIFHKQHRLDYDRIVELIPNGASVLDLGCGHGGLLSRLKERGHKPVMGVEWSEEAIVACAQRGLDVVQADVNKGLTPFADRQFEFVVLSQTLQAITNVEGVLNDMLRVGRRGVVSFPNFGYAKLRRMLMEDGRVPKASGLLRFHWYDTPNIRYLTIADFEDFCAERGIKVHQRIGLNTEEGREVTGDVNALADMAIFVISR
jgi:homoserine O-acetyltransferase